MTPANAEMLREEFRGECAYCDNAASTWDHVIPVSRGGRTDQWNIVPACVSCNSSKRDTELDTFLERRPNAKVVLIYDRLSMEHLPLGGPV